MDSRRVRAAAIAGISMKDDGSFERLAMPRREASRDFEDGVASKDVHFKATEGGHELWARIFLPQHTTTQVSTTYPVLLYFHGGGFVFLSVAHFLYHGFFHRLAKTAHVIIVAFEYRLAPEHRLPAAYEDALSSLKWMQSQALHQQDPWLWAYANFSRCYLSGDSAGANMVHHLSLILPDLHPQPLCIRGHFLIQPFFGGVDRTRTEEIMANDARLPRWSIDWLWDRALPEGADQDHPACNFKRIPFSMYRNAHIPKTWIMVAQKDPLKERQMQYYEMLKEAGVDVQLHLHEGFHGCQLVDGTTFATSFMNCLASFLQNESASKL